MDLSGAGTCTRVSTGATIDASLGAGSYTIDPRSCDGLGLGGPDAANYTLSLVGSTFNVDPAPLSVMVSGSQTACAPDAGSCPSTRTFTAVPTSHSLPQGVLPVSGTPSCATVNSGASITSSLAPGTYAIDAGSCSGPSLTGPNASNYKLSLVGGAFTVYRAQLLVAVSGSEEFESSPSFASTLVPHWPSGVGVSGTASCTTVDSGTPITDSMTVGTYEIDTGSCSGLSLTGSYAGYYVLSLIGAPFNVSPAAVQVTVTGSQITGLVEEAPAFTAEPTSGSLPPGVTLTGIPRCTTVNSGTPISDLPSGHYTIDASSCTGLSLTGANAANYEVSFVGAAFWSVVLPSLPPK